jgi:hypothetical protein
VLQYTGGTTGVSKGAVLLHRNLMANVLQSEAWNSPVMAKVPKGEQPTSVCALPLYHIFAFTVGMMLSMRMGGKLILIPNPRDCRPCSRSCPSTPSTASRPSTRCSTAGQPPGFQHRRLEQPEGFGGRRHGGAKRAWPSCGWRRPAARSAKATA